MQIRVVIAAAVGTMAWTAPALAADPENFVNFVQVGNSHNGFVEQTGTGNQAGTGTMAVTQTGFDNNLAATQSGNNNTLGILGDGVLQNGVIFNDSGDYANSATIVQNSSGNEIGELVQFSNADHFTVGNALTVTQDLGDFNTIISIRQSQAAGASSNVAAVTQTGIHNWLQNLTQIANSAEGSNSITYQATGNYNGLNGTQDGAGTLAVLAQSSGATASSLVQDQDTSGAAHNTMSMIVTGNSNQYGMTQYGTDNSAGVTVTGLSNSFGSFQIGRHNQITTGGIAGDSNDMGIRQVGYANTASAILHWSSSDNRIGLGQSGDANVGDISLKGDRNIVGLSQSGRGNVGTVNANNGLLDVADNVVVMIQYNSGATNAVGNSASVTLNGDRNNALVGGHPQSFSGVALDLASTGPILPASLSLAPDVTTLLGAHGGNLLLVPGMLVQWGQGNSLEITVGSTLPSSDNLFSALQQGDRNRLVASIAGTANQLVAYQSGDDNLLMTDQSGSDNIIAVSQ